MLQKTALCGAPANVAEKKRNDERMLARSLNHVVSAIAFAAANPIFALGDQQPSSEIQSEFQETCNLSVDCLKKSFFLSKRAAAVLESPWRLDLLNELDPSNHYFLEEDFAHFRELSTVLSPESLDFEFAKAVLNRWSQRVENGEKFAVHWLAQPHDFSKDEVVPIKYERFAATQDELSERWRTKIKRELLGDRIGGVPSDVSVSSLQSRFQKIFDQQQTLNMDDLLTRYLDVLVRKIDPNGGYWSADELADFETGLVLPWSIGLKAEVVDEEWQTTGVWPSFLESVDGDSLPNIVGLRLISVKSGDVEMIFHGREALQTWRSIGGLRPNHQEFGKAETVILELRDPYSRRRIEVQWPRTKIRRR